MTDKPVPEESSEKKFSVFTEGILLAIIPALGYIVAFSYESGRADFFGIPTSIISVSIDTYFVSIVSILVVAFVLFLVAQMFFMAVPNKHREHVFLFYPLLVVILYFVGISFVSLDIGRTLRALVISVILISYLYILPIVNYRSINGWVNRIKYDRILDEIIDAKSPLKQFLYRFFGTGLSYLIVVFGFSYIFSEELGRTAAITKDEYFVIPYQFFQRSQSTDFAVVAIYGETIVAAPLDRSQSSIEQSFVFLRLTEASGIRLRREKIGPLRVTSE